MSTLTHLTHLDTLGPWLHRVRLAWQLPVQATAPARPARPGHWLERLAAWSDRQPPRQHRMGSYTALT